jgi:hypothetical protein
VNIEGLFEPYVSQPNRNPYIEGAESLGNVPTSESAPSTPSVVSSAPGDGQGSSASTVANVPEKVALNGPRLDDPSGWGTRYRLGKLSDGSYGVERFTSSGTRQTIVWS